MMTDTAPIDFRSRVRIRPLPLLPQQPDGQPVPTTSAAPKPPDRTIIIKDQVTVQKIETCSGSVSDEGTYQTWPVPTAALSATWRLASGKRFALILSLRVVDAR